MTPMKAQEILSILAGAYPNQQLTEAMADTWANVLATVNFHEAERAAREWVKHEQWWPKPAELNSLVTRLAREDRDEGRLQAPSTNVRCDGSRWIDKGQGPTPCPACNPWQWELWNQGELHQRHPKAPDNFVMPPACRPHYTNDQPVTSRGRAVQLMVAGYREAKREQGMDEATIDARLADRYKSILAWASVIPQPLPEQVDPDTGEVFPVEVDERGDEEVGLGEVPGR